MIRKPVSDKVLELILKKLERAELIEGLLGFKKGAKKAEIIFNTSEGKVPCQVVEDDLFIYFEMPSGTQDLAILKIQFWQEFSQ